MTKKDFEALEDICFRYYEHWEYVENIRNDYGYTLYGLNDTRIKLHEELLEISGLKREELLPITDNMCSYQGKSEFCLAVCKKLESSKL